MRTKRIKIIREYQKDISTLTGKRKKLFENMRKIYPKGNEELQKGLCLDLDESRLDYYINHIFNPEEKR
jgi:hypothetical protein